MNRPFTDLNLGFSNAENYQRRENKELLEKYFVRDDFLEQLLDPNVFYLVGEKGTGKTAYATYLRNSNFKGHKVSVFDVRQTEYHKFLELKKQGHLPLSQYAEVWRVLLLMSVASSILANSGTPDFLQRFTKLGAIKKAIDEFYDNAFAPEIVKMLSFVESAKVASSLIAKYVVVGSKVGAEIVEETHDSQAIFQTHLLKIRQGFEAAIGALRLDQNAVIFIDGIDIRPADIAYEDYFECIRGLIEGLWSLNADFLSNIKDSPGRVRGGA
jgi:hypothetical protein